MDEHGMGPLEAMQAVVVARRHFIDDLPKTQIADELGISRFKVARLIDDAIAHGLLRIEIAMPYEIDFDTSERLKSTYRLDDAVVMVSPDTSSETTRDQLASLAASTLPELVDAGDVIGIGCGRTLNAMADPLPELPACSVVQIAGNMPTDDYWLNTTQLFSSFRTRCAGRLYPLHAPFIVDDHQIAKRWRSETSIRPTVEMFAHVTKALVGIGSWAPESSGYLEVLTEAETRELRAAGVRADVCSALLDDDGQPIETHLTDRIIGMTTEELSAVPQVIAVAGGADKGNAVRAALRSGLVSILITDNSAADVALG